MSNLMRAITDEQCRAREKGLGPCGNPPAVVIDDTASGGDYQPVCAYHLHRYQLYDLGPVVPLAEILRAYRLSQELRRPGQARQR